MNKIQKLIYSDAGRYIISILLGIGLATLFKKTCKDRSCMKFYAPPFDAIKGKVYKFDDECYTFEDQATTCLNEMETIEFENKSLV